MQVPTVVFLVAYWNLMLAGWVTVNWLGCIRPILWQLLTFDATNDDVQVVAPMTVASAPSNNYTATWSTVDTGSMTLKFGDANNDQAKSAYLSNEMFGAQIQDDGTQIDGTSGGSNNLAGVLVSWETIDTDGWRFIS